MLLSGTVKEEKDRYLAGHDGKAEQEQGAQRIILFNGFKIIFDELKVANHGGRSGIYVDDAIAVNRIFVLAVALGEVVGIKAMLC